jgi:hypothetical protein
LLQTVVMRGCEGRVKTSAAPRSIRELTKDRQRMEGNVMGEEACNEAVQCTFIHYESYLNPVLQVKGLYTSRKFQCVAKFYENVFQHGVKYSGFKPSFFLSFLNQIASFGVHRCFPEGPQLCPSTEAYVMPHIRHNLYI